MRYDKELHWIYVASDIKFRNNIFPQLPYLISVYLMVHPEKAELYFTKKIKLKDLLRYIHITFIRNKYTNIMDAVVAYIEGEEHV